MKIKNVTRMISMFLSTTLIMTQQNTVLFTTMAYGSSLEEKTINNEVSNNIVLSGASEDNLLTEAIGEQNTYTENSSQSDDAIDPNVASQIAIANNGLGGIYIDISAEPFSTMNYNNSAYSESGCGWFASARAQQLTGKVSSVWNGTAWWNNENGIYDFPTGHEPRAKSVICYNNHVAILEKIDGDTVYISEGGYTAGSAESGYTRIFQTTKNEIANLHKDYTRGLLGYVYLDNISSAIDAPSEGQIYYDDQLLIQGWVAPASGVSAIKYYVNGSEQGSLSLYDREAIGAKGGRLEITMDDPSGVYKWGTNTITLKAVYSDGKVIEMGSRAIDRNFAWAQDSPESVTNIISEDVHVQGWAYNSGKTFRDFQMSINGGAYVTLESYKRTGVAVDHAYGYNCNVSNSKFRIGSNTLVVKVNYTDGYSRIFETRTINKKDTQKPIISDVKVMSINKDGYTLSCKATDNVGVASVKFSTATSASGLKDWKDITVTNINNGIATCTVKTLDYSNTEGQYVTDVYAYDTSGNCSDWSLSASYQPIIDRTAPIISNIETTKLSNISYKVSCKIIDNSDLRTVKFGTTVNGKETVWTDAVIKNNLCETVVNVLDFSNEAGNYTSSIRAVDTFDNESTATADSIELVSKEKPLTKLDINKNTINIQRGDNEVLYVIYTPTDTTDNKNVKWKSSNEKIVTVNNEGTITAQKIGTAKITATVGNRTATCVVTVTEKLREINIDRDNFAFYKGEAYSFSVCYLPEDTTDSKEVVWTSENPNIVSIDNKGNIIGKHKGSTTITATSCVDASISDSCTVTVSSNIVTFDSCGGSNIEPIECGMNGVINISELIPEKADNIFTGWYKDIVCTQPWVDNKDVVTENITLYAGWAEPKEDFWVMDIPTVTYTGEAIRPTVAVYDGTSRLAINKDYKVSYKNNTNVYLGGDGNKKPQVIVKGIGNYSGTQIVPFVIQPKSLEDDDVKIADIYKAVSEKEQKPVPTVYWGNKKLTYNKTSAKSHYLLSYGEGNYKDAGNYEITISGTGNYSGNRICDLTLTEKKLISKAKVKITSSMPYNQGNAVVPKKLTVKMGKTLLRENTDYSLEYRNNKQVGTATVVITGMGDYSGIKNVNYKITGQKLSKAKITGIVNKEYTGEPIYQSYSVTNKKNSLKLHEDFQVTYQKNTNSGTAVMIFTGSGGYTGTVKKTFKITQYSFKNNALKYFTNDGNNISVKYEKSGAKPDVAITFRGTPLSNGKDYTLSYKNNTAVNNGKILKKVPTIIIKGKGNFKDSVNKSFAIIPGDLMVDGIRISAKDVIYKDKVNAYKSTPVLTDGNGKKLVAGKDYSKAYEYRYNDETGSIIGESEKPPVGSVIFVKVTGTKNYAGSSVGATYRIVGKSIAKAKVKVKAQTYTGTPITISQNDIESIAIGKVTLGTEDYEILPNTYVNNTKKGTAKVTVRGRGDYGQEKVISFPIAAKKLE